MNNAPGTKRLAAKRRGKPEQEPALWQAAAEYASEKLKDTPAAGTPEEMLRDYRAVQRKLAKGWKWKAPGYWERP